VGESDYIIVPTDGKCVCCVYSLFFHIETLFVIMVLIKRSFFVFLFSLLMKVIVSLFRWMRSLLVVFILCFFIETLFVAIVLIK
jgi:hypothetical protein